MYRIIVNPSSRSGQGGRLWRRVQRRLESGGIPYEVHFTRYRGDGKRLAAKLTQEGWEEKDTLLVIGGDGTVNEAVNGIESLDRVTLGYIPTGSGNDFARAMGIPGEPEAALERILRREGLRRIDVGSVLLGKKRRRFVISAGIGFDAAICHEALSSRLKDTLNRLGLGKLTYACIALRLLVPFETCTLYAVQQNGERKRFEKTYFAAVMNFPYEGGGLKFAPDAVWDDGCLDVMVASGLPKWKVLCVLPFAFFGMHTRFPEVHSFRCSSVVLEAEQGMAVHTDGESGGCRKKIELRVEQKRLKVVGCGETAQTESGQGGAFSGKAKELHKDFLRNFKHN